MTVERLDPRLPMRPKAAAPSTGLAPAAEPGGQHPSLETAFAVWLFFCLICGLAALTLGLDFAEAAPGLILAATPAALCLGLGPARTEPAGRLFMIAAWIAFATLFAAIAGPFSPAAAALFLIAPGLGLRLGDRGLALDGLIAACAGYGLAIGAYALDKGAPGRGADFAAAAHAVPAFDLLLALAAVIWIGWLSVAGMHDSLAPAAESEAFDLRLAGRFRLGPDGDVIQADGQGASLLSRRPDALWGARLWALFEGTAQENLRQAIRAAAQTGAPQVLRGLAIPGGGAADALLRPIADRSAAPALLRRPDLEALLTPSPAAAASADLPGAGAPANESEFAAVLAHELRTPLNAAIAYAELAALDPKAQLTAKTQAYLERIQLSGKRMLALIDSALQWAQLEAGTQPLGREDCDLEAILREAAGYFPSPEQSGERRIELLAAPGSPALVHGADPQALRQIAVNFLTNAVKYSPRGATVTAAVFAEPGALGFEIRNPAPEMAPGDAERLLARFAREADAKTTGAGLGLAIAARLAKAMNGRVRLSVSEDRVFIARLTIASGPAAL